MTRVEVTEDQFVSVMKDRGFEDWDIEVALGGLRRGAELELDFGGEFKFALKDAAQISERPISWPSPL